MIPSNVTWLVSRLGLHSHELEAIIALQMLLTYRCANTSKYFNIFTLIGSQSLRCFSLVGMFLDCFPSIIKFLMILTFTKKVRIEAPHLHQLTVQLSALA